MKQLLLPLFFVASAWTASAQSPIVGINLLGSDHLFDSNTSNFVNSWTVGAPILGRTLYAIDFDATATTLYGIDFPTSELGTIDLGTGQFTTVGNTGIPANRVRGMTVHPNGVDCYVIAAASTGNINELWQGNLQTGVFTSLGLTGPNNLFIDIACDSQGNLFALGTTNNNLFTIDPTTLAATFLGGLGVGITSAQGMDFDWSDDTLYATLYFGAGDGMFSSLDTTTGARITSESTLPLNAEMEMAVQVPAGTAVDVGTPFCDPMNLNSTGQSTKMTGRFNAPTGTGLHLEATQGPPGEFGYFLIGTAVSDPGLPLSNGRLCLSVSGGNGFGRYNVIGGNLNSVGSFSAIGTLQNAVGTSSTGFGFDVPNTIPMMGSPMIMTGQTWHFQLWHRDTAAGAGSSNFSNGLSVTF